MANKAKAQARELRDAQARVAELEERLAELEAYVQAAVWIDPGRQGGVPCLGGHRIPVESIVQILDGDTGSEEAALRFYPQLTREQVQLALWYHDRYADTDRTCRWPRPVIHIDPGIRGGRPAIAGVSCEAYAERVHAGESLDEVADDYGVTREQVLLACWWIATMERQPRWAKAWENWGGQAHLSLWRGMYDGIEGPPDRDELAVARAEQGEP